MAAVKRRVRRPVPRGRAAPLGAKPVRIAIADDHRILREGVRKLLEAEPGFEVVGEAADGAEAIDLVRKASPDVLLLDLAMPGIPGLEVLRQVASLPGVRVLLLTASSDRREIGRALQLGACGVVMKGSPSQLLFRGIRGVMEGRYWLGREGVTDLAGYLQERETPASPYNLTPREVEIVEVVARGFANKDIALQLGISEQTVKHHLTSIYDKVGVSNRLELALFAVQRRLSEQ